MTLNQGAERLAFALNDPLNYQLKQNLKLSIKYWRASLIRKDIVRNGQSEDFLQRIYVDLVKVDKADACNFNLDCQILRTKFELPKPIRLNNDILFKFFGDINGKPWTYTEYEEVAYTAYNKFTSDIIRYTYVNNYGYIFGNNKLKKAAIQAPWADPAIINTTCGTECYNDDMEFPISLDMFQMIMDGILSREFRILNPKDNEVEIESEGIRQQQ